MLNRFLLTQIICGDISKNVSRMVHEIKKRLNMPLKCLCCQPKIEKDQQIKPAEQSTQAEKNEKSQVMG